MRCFHDKGMGLNMTNPLNVLNPGLGMCVYIDICYVCMYVCIYIYMYIHISFAIFLTALTVCPQYVFVVGRIMIQVVR